MGFDNTILLKIKRKFSTDEAVKVMLKKLAELEQEIGVLKSEISEKEDIIAKKNVEIHDLRYKEVDSKRGWLRDELIADLDKEVKFYKGIHEERERKYKELEILYSRALVQLKERS